MTDVLNQDPNEIVKDLSSGDIVRVYGLTSEQGKLLNGKEGRVLPKNYGDKNTKDFELDPLIAKLDSGRYGVCVQLSEVPVVSTASAAAARIETNIPTKMVKLKRENLKVIKAQPRSILKSVGKKDTRALEKSLGTHTHTYIYIYTLHKICTCIIHTYMHACMYTYITN